MATFACTSFRRQSYQVHCLEGVSTSFDVCSMLEKSESCAISLTRVLCIVGPRGVVPGVVTAAAACTAVQYLFNEARVTRIKWMYDRKQSTTLSSAPSRPFDSLSPSPPTSTDPVATSEVPLESFPPQPKSLSDRAFNALSYVFPISRVPDDEYLASLRAKQTKVEAQLRETRRDLEGHEEAERRDRDSK